MTKTERLTGIRVLLIEEHFLAHQIAESLEEDEGAIVTHTAGPEYGLLGLINTHAVDCTVIHVPIHSWAHDIIKAHAAGKKIAVLERGMFGVVDRKLARAYSKMKEANIPHFKKEFDTYPIVLAAILSLLSTSP